MIQPILRTEGLTKRFGALTAVNNVNLEIYEGDIYGFLGLNGAGKTTTIRMLLGLIKPTNGKVFIFDKDIKRNLLSIMYHIGALVETPTFYPYLSAYKNLEILRLASRNVSKSRVDEVLGAVGLLDRKHSKVKTYSQGMKQRLGIAQALLSNPRFAILDEPTNGLDPQGINYIRTMIKELNNKQGVTFLISSHLLHEVEITCTRVGIIHKGTLLIEDKVDKLLSGNINYVRIKALPIEKAKEILNKIDWIREFEALEDGVLKVGLESQNFARLNTELVSAGVSISEFTPIKVSLEEYFLAKSVSQNGTK